MNKHLLLMLVTLLKNTLLMLVMLLAVSAPDMSVKDVAAYLGVTTRTVYMMLADGRLKGYKCGYRLIRFRRDEVDSALIPIDPVTEPMANVPPPTQSRGGPHRRRAESESEFAAAP
jgi:excisionase family DNA binding protein